MLEILDQIQAAEAEAGRLAADGQAEAKKWLAAAQRQGDALVEQRKAAALQAQQQLLADAKAQADAAKEAARARAQDETDRMRAAAAPQMEHAVRLIVERAVNSL